MIFMAARAADCLNVFVGLWLVPKYVEPSELGAVMPLTQFATFLAMPAAVFASTFRNELTGLATRREFGKMKTLMRSVFIATAVFFFLAIVVCHFVLPHYLERIRVAEGSLGMLVLIASFLGTVAPVYSNALQSLKKFKASSVISLIGAPVRFLTMIVMMPFRAISGYFVGQSSVPAFSIVASVIALRKELSVEAEPYWTKPVIRRFSTIFGLFLIGAFASGFSSLVEATVLRQRLPELDSAAYYMVTRFSDIAGFVASALTMTIFPYAADLAAKGRSTNPLVVKTSVAVLLSNAALVVFFCLFGKTILLFLPNGNLYASYWWAIPWIIGISTLGQFSAFCLSAETAANRFRYMRWSIPLHFAYPAIMLFVTGYGYFVAMLPKSWCDWFASNNITSLGALLLWMSAFNVVKLCFCIAEVTMKKARVQI